MLAVSGGDLESGSPTFDIEDTRVSFGSKADIAAANTGVALMRGFRWRFT